jgi:hypothetical protein
MNATGLVALKFWNGSNRSSLPCLHLPEIRGHALDKLDRRPCGSQRERSRPDLLNRDQIPPPLL